MTAIPPASAEPIVPLPAPAANRAGRPSHSNDQIHAAEPVQGQQSNHDTRQRRTDTDAEGPAVQADGKTAGHAEGKQPVGKKKTTAAEQTDTASATAEVAPVFAEVIRDLVGAQDAAAGSESDTAPLPQAPLQDHARVLASGQAPVVLAEQQASAATGAETDLAARAPIEAAPLVDNTVSMPLHVASGTGQPVAPEAPGQTEPDTQGTRQTPVAPVLADTTDVAARNETPASLQVDTTATREDEATPTQVIEGGQATVTRGDEATPTQVIEGGQAARMSAQPQSVVGAETRPEAGDDATEAGLAVVHPTRSRLSPQQARAPEPTRPATGPARTRTAHDGSAPADITLNETATVEAAGARAAPAETAERPKTASSIAATETAGPEQADSIADSQAAPAPRVAAAAGAVHSVAADQVAEQVRQAAPQVGQRVVVRLDPPELGHVRLTLRGGRGGIRGVIEVDDARTLAQLRDATPPVIERLAEGGIQLRRLDLVLSGNSPQVSPDGSNSSFRDGALAQQQDAAGQGLREQNGLSARAGAEDPTPRAGSAAGPSYVSDDSINVWI